MNVHDFLDAFNREMNRNTKGFELRRRLKKEEKFLKWTIYHLLAEGIYLHYAAKYQEKFHTKVDYMAADYKTWKDAGCKHYAKPKQYVSGEIAKIAKRSFDTVLGEMILQKKGAAKALTARPFEENFDFDAA